MTRFTRRTLLTALPAWPAVLSAQPALAPHATLQGQQLLQAESALLRAMQARDESGLEQWLDDSFQMVVAQAAGEPVGRDEWIERIVRSGAGAYTIDGASVLADGSAGVASFLLRPAGGDAKRRAIFVVDTWKRDGAAWKLVRRHAAVPAPAGRREIPGDGPSAAPRKMI